MATDLDRGRTRRRRRLRLFALVITLGIGVVHPTTALAQSAEAEALFNDGDRLFKAGRIDEACDAFDASNRIEPRAGTMIRLGECRERQGRLASAWSAYRDALTRVKDPYKKKVATDRIAALEPTLSKLTIAVPEGSRIDALAITRNGAAVDPGLWSRAIPTDGGELVFVAKAPGFKDWTKAVTVPVANGSVRVDVPRLEPVPVVAEPPVAGGPDRRGEAVRVGNIETAPEGGDAPPPSWLTNKRKIALGVGALALGAAAIGALLGGSAKGLEDDAYVLCPDPQTPCADAARAMDLAERGATRSTYANIAFGTGAGAAIAATVLWFVGAPGRGPSHRVSVTPRIEHGFAGAALGGRF